MNIEITDSVLIACPDRGFNLRKARYCFECEYYQGSIEPAVNGVPIENPSIDQVQIICGKPITRKLSVMESN